MKKNCLHPDRQQMLTEYIQSLTTSSVNYDNRGKYIDAVYRFLDSAEEVSRRGWKRWKKAHAEELIYMPWVQDAVCNLLASRGIGYKPKREQPGKARYIDKIEKRDVRQTDTINGFLLWLENEREYSPNTLRIYSYSVRDFFSYFDEFSQDNARRYIAALEEKGNNPKTIRLRITSLEKLGDYLKKPVKLKRPKIQKTLSVENIPTEAEYNKLLTYCDEHAPKWAYIIRLLGTTGCRVSELIQFTYEQIQAGSCDLKGKGSKYRRFFFTRQVQDGAKGKSGYVCMNRYGSQISTRGIAQELKNLGTKCGIAKEKMHPHAFRHFFAKMYLKKTKDVVSLADILGHGSVDITRIYLQKSYDEQKREVNRVVNW